MPWDPGGRQTLGGIIFLLILNSKRVFLNTYKCYMVAYIGRFSKRLIKSFRRLVGCRGEAERSIELPPLGRTDLPGRHRLHGLP